MNNRKTAIELEEVFRSDPVNEQVDAERRVREYLSVVQRVYEHLKRHHPKILTVLRKRANLKRVPRR